MPDVGLRVSAEGEATASPNLATVRVGVEERARSAQEAMELANLTMRRVTDAVKALGVQPRDVQTSELNVHFERRSEQPYLPPPSPPDETTTNQPTKESTAGSAGAAVPQPGEDAAPDRLTTTSTERSGPEGHYVVRNTVVIAMRQLDKVGEVIGAAMTAGANHLYGFQLSIEDPSKLESQARELAIDAAIEKARRMAARAGVELGPILSITESGSAPPMPYAESRMALKSSADQSVPVEQGQMSVRQTVEVTFALDGEQDDD